jgi:hypothetical protein
VKRIKSSHARNRWMWCIEAAHDRANALTKIILAQRGFRAEGPRAPGEYRELGVKPYKSRRADVDLVF